MQLGYRVILFNDANCEIDRRTCDFPEQVPALCKEILDNGFVVGDTLKIEYVEIGD